MIAILSVAQRELERAFNYLAWVHELGGCKAHQLVIVVANPVSTEDCKSLKDVAANSFRSVEVIRQKERCELPWPKNANAMFRCAAEYMRSKLVKDFFLWVELDAIPIRSSWLDVIEGEYKLFGKAFMGSIYNKPVRHLNGVAVYPSTVSSINPWMVSATEKPFDLTRPDIALRFGTDTKLIVRSLANPIKNLPHSFPNQDSLSLIPAGCVLFHGCKDGSLIQRLREKNGKTSHKKVEAFKATRNPSSITYKASMFQKLSSAKIKLPSVTVWAAAWSSDAANLQKTIRVLRYCDRILNPDMMILFSYLPVQIANNPFDVIQIPQLDWQRWNPFVNRTVPNHIATDFALSVHEDGFPIDMECWDPQFLKYDYIGAPWQDGVVGNGGFNIESRKLMEAKLKLPFEPDEMVTASDMFICRNRGDVLKSKGIKFAPRDVALRFSTELFGNQWPSFGFHGRQWATEKYSRGWKLIESHGC